MLLKHFALGASLAYSGSDDDISSDCCNFPFSIQRHLSLGAKHEVSKLVSGMGRPLEADT